MKRPEIPPKVVADGRIVEVTAVLVHRVDGVQIRRRTHPRVVDPVADDFGSFGPLGGMKRAWFLISSSWLPAMSKVAFGIGMLVVRQGVVSVPEPRGRWTTNQGRNLREVLTRVHSFDPQLVPLADREPPSSAFVVRLRIDVPAIPPPPGGRTGGPRSNPSIGPKAFAINCSINPIPYSSSPSPIVVRTHLRRGRIHELPMTTSAVVGLGNEPEALARSYVLEVKLQIVRPRPFSIELPNVGLDAQKRWWLGWLEGEQVTRADGLGNSADHIGKITRRSDLAWRHPTPSRCHRWIHAVLWTRNQGRRQNQKSALSRRAGFRRGG